MLVRKHNKKSNNRSTLIWLICFIMSGVLLYVLSSEVLTQESDLQESSQPASKVEIKSFLDSSYNRLYESEIISEQKTQIHPFAASKNQCNKCHEVYKTTGAEASYIVFIENSSKFLNAACLRCHPQGPADHPILITTSFAVPKDLPLSEKKEITCITCHNPHLQRFSNRSWLPRSFTKKLVESIFRKKQYKTYFLRRNNANKELCLGCHKSLRQQWQF